MIRARNNYDPIYVPIVVRTVDAKNTACRKFHLPCGAGGM
jgi:hypothetical protein